MSRLNAVFKERNRIVEKHLSIRNARDNERRIIRDLTIAAYAQYQAVMPPGFWIRYQHNLIATLDAEGNGERLVAEQNGSIVGSHQRLIPMRMLSSAPPTRRSVFSRCSHIRADKGLEPLS